MKFNPLPWLLILATFGLALWVRFNLFEQDNVGLLCDRGGQARACHFLGLVRQSFSHGGLGFFGLFFGVLATITRSAFIGLLAGMVGMAGLVLYNWDFAGVGFLLGVLTLARAQFDEFRSQDGTGQQQA